MRVQVAADEDQSKSIIVLRAISVLCLLCPLCSDKERQHPRLCGASASEIIGPVSRGNSQPSSGRPRYAITDPDGECPSECILHTLLGEIDITRVAHRRGEDGSPLTTVRIRNLLLD